MRPISAHPLTTSRTLFRFCSLCVLLALGTTFLWPVQPARAQAGSADELIAAVNTLRAANGLEPLAANPLLMGIAQAHSEYQASIGEATHTGVNGSTPRDRAVAAGYGGGVAFFLSENVQGGSRLSPQAAVNAWKKNNDHWKTMMGSYREVGAGVATAGNFVVYTLDTAYIASDPAQSGPTATPAGTQGPTPLPVYGVQTVTPYPDGLIVHIVLSGQTLYSIAEAYGVTVNDLLALNNRKVTDPLFVGDKIIVRQANTVTPTSDVTYTPTPLPPTATSRPTKTATPRPPTRTPTLVPTSTPTPTPEPFLGNDPVGNGLLGGMALLLVVGIGFVIAGSVMKVQARKDGT